jgi:hypothetical protein
MTPTGGPHLSVRGRERRGRGSGGPFVGRKRALGRGWKRKGGVEVGRGVGWVCSLFFLFFFKSIFKPISNLFRFKSFTSFQIQILTHISPTILKAFHKPFLTTFQHILNSNLYTNFHNLFHNYF